MTTAPTRRLLVTGRSGFVGQTLSQVLEQTAHGERWALVDIAPDFDLRDSSAVRRLIETARPDAVIHLAAQSAVPASIRDPETTLQVNLVGTLHLLQALDGVEFKGRLLYVGTGDVYGLVPESELPVAEARVPRPRNPYAVSKLAAEALCWQWHASKGMDVVLARPFNHIGPGQSDRFAVSDFARQVADIRRGRQRPVIRVGDLDVTRDFTDVRDVIEAYFALLDRGEAGETYNICSGTEHSLRSLLEQLIALGNIQVRIEPQAERMRRAEQKRMCGDATKIRRATGWRPIKPITASLQGTLQFWMEQIAND